MARRRYHRYYREDSWVDFVGYLLFLLGLGLFGWGYTHQQELELYGSIAIGIIVIAIVVYFIFRRRRINARFGLSDEKLLYMLKGMPPSQFEREVADMFEGLGYSTEVTGGANDGGIDVVARKDGKKYYIQCKKFMTREVTPHDVRDFLGAITNINNPADKGFFVTTNGFTLMAEKAAEGNPRIELIDGTKLVQYYKLADKNEMPQKEVSAPTVVPKKCPRCGGELNQEQRSTVNLPVINSGVVQTILHAPILRMPDCPLIIMKRAWPKNST